MSPRVGTMLTEAAEFGDLEALAAAIRDTVRAWVGAGPVFIATADPVSGSFTGTFAFDIPDDAAAAFYAIETSGSDIGSFAALSRSVSPLGSLYTATHARPQASQRWRDVIEPLGWGDELRAVLRLNGTTWGYLCVHREAYERPFTTHETDRIAGLLPVITAAVRRTAVPLTDTTGRPSLATGVVLLDADCNVVGLTGGAAAWLDEIGPRPPDGLPLLLAGLTRAVLTTGQPSIRTIETRTRRLAVIEAAALDRDAQAQAVIVISAAPTRHKLDHLAAACGLTVREREIVSAVLTGLSTQAIAQQLTISPYTVQAHLTSVFTKTRLRSRRELISRLSS